MNKLEERNNTYIQIMRNEMISSMGCTEPVSIAYCAAKARATLNEIPQRIEVKVSGNIIKNAKSVIVPNTNGMKGIEAAIAIGVIAGDESAGLEVLRLVSDEQIEKFKKYLENTNIVIRQAENDLVFDISVHVFGMESDALVRIANTHTNVVRIEKNSVILMDKDISDFSSKSDLNYNLLNIKDIYDFAMDIQLESVTDLLDKQIVYNTAISEEGLRHEYGANIGSVLLDSYGKGIKNRAKATAAAGSDARMNGCELPVIINSGSGNQGLTVSLPVIEYAKELKVNKNTLYRALIISNLTAIHQKVGIGYLSAYCGAVSAGAAAGAGIAFLRGGNYEDIAHTIVNALAITSGIVCDGAKASCAAKIATAIDAGILGYDMYRKGQQFYAGDGLVSENVEKTIRNVGQLGKSGMKETDKEILCIMTCFD